MNRYDNIVLNIPHSSYRFPEKNFIKKYWGDSYLAAPDLWEITDVDTDLIFKTKMKNVKSLVFPYSRFYCDVERLINDPLEKEGQGIIYENCLNFKRTVDDAERKKIMGIYFSHIEKLKSLINENTLLIDCHSFSGIESNIDVCIGFNEDWSKPEEWVINLIKNEFKTIGLRVGINTPYSNSISPLKENCNYHSIMIELNKNMYIYHNIDCFPFAIKYLNVFMKYLYKKIFDYEN